MALPAYLSGVDDIPLDFDLSVARGSIPGMSHVHKFGFNGTVGASFETCWTMSTVYAYLAASTLLNISSGSVDDTAAGSGAQKISIAGLDENYLLITEDVITNGQTAVPTKKKYLRVHRMKVIEGAANAGIVYAGTGGPASGVLTTTYGAIAVGYGQTLQALYSVPGGHTAYLYRFSVTSGVSKNVVARFMVKERGGVFQVKDLINLVENTSTSIWKYPMEIPQKCDIEVQVSAGAGGGSVSASFTMLLVQDK